MCRESQKVLRKRNGRHSGIEHQKRGRQKQLGPGGSNKINNNNGRERFNFIQEGEGLGNFDVVYGGSKGPHGREGKRGGAMIGSTKEQLSPIKGGRNKTTILLGAPIDGKDGGEEGRARKSYLTS